MSFRQEHVSFLRNTKLLSNSEGIVSLNWPFDLLVQQIYTQSSQKRIVWTCVSEFRESTLHSTMENTLMSINH